MEPDQTASSANLNIFARFGDQISEACERAIREALQRHKAAGNPVAVARDGQVVLLQPHEIEA
jgi:isoaspartyl peptidase/L-asparaginase-like protein (Ntn-hydrolase superfamily)